MFDDHTAAVTSVRFGHNANFLVSASMDRSIKFYGQEWDVYVFVCIYVCVCVWGRQYTYNYSFISR